MLRGLGFLSLLCCVNVFAGEPSFEHFIEGNRVRAANIAQLDNEKILVEEARLAPLASDLLLKVKPMIHKDGSGKVIQDYLLAQFERYDLRPMLVGYHGYSEAVPVSVNNQVANALPTDTPFPAAALVKVELVAASAQAHVAQAWTFASPEATEQQRELLSTARKALQSGIAQIRAGEKLATVGHAIQQVLDDNKAIAVRELSGYSMGQARVQSPLVPGYKGIVDDNALMQAGQVLNVHVVAKGGTWGVRYQPPDFMTLLTQDGTDSVMLSAMVEVTNDGYRLLSKLID